MLFSKLLNSPSILYFGKPISRTTKSFSKKSIELKAASMLDDLRDPNKVSTLFSLLSQICKDPEWAEYFNLAELEFEWSFFGNWNSSNPFFELHMRCLQRLLHAYQKVISGYSSIDMVKIKALVNAINVSFLETQETHVTLPFHVWPPCSYSNEYPYRDRGCYFIPFFGSHSIQIVLNLIAVETWMNLLEEKIYKLLDGKRGDSNEGCAKKYINDLFKGIVNVTRACFIINNPWSKYQQFKDFCFFRYDTKNRYSDINKLYALANTLYLDEIPVELTEYMKKVMSGFTPEVKAHVGKIIQATEDEEERPICNKPIEFLMFGKTKDKLSTSALSLSITRKPISGISKFSMRMPKSWMLDKLSVKGEFESEDENDIDEEIFVEGRKMCCGFFSFCRRT